MLSKKTLCATLLAAATSAVLPTRADNPTYVLGVPSAPTIYLSNDAGDNAWLSANANFAAASIAVTTGGVSRVVDIDAPRLTLHPHHSTWNEHTFGINNLDR